MKAITAKLYLLSSIGLSHVNLEPIQTKDMKKASNGIFRMMNKTWQTKALGASSLLDSWKKVWDTTLMNLNDSVNQ